MLLIWIQAEIINAFTRGTRIIVQWILGSLIRYLFYGSYMALFCVVWPNSNARTRSFGRSVGRRVFALRLERDNGMWYI